ncbi:MAG: hypothetical protein Tsb0021_16780 [Chlamydiales bacterium]
MFIRRFFQPPSVTTQHTNAQPMHNTKPDTKVPNPNEIYNQNHTKVAPASIQGRISTDQPKTSKQLLTECRNTFGSVTVSESYFSALKEVLNDPKMKETIQNLLVAHETAKQASVKMVKEGKYEDFLQNESYQAFAQLGNDLVIDVSLSSFSFEVQEGIKDFQKILCETICPQNSQLITDGAALILDPSKGDNFESSGKEGRYAYSIGLMKSFQKQKKFPAFSIPLLSDYRVRFPASATTELKTMTILEKSTWKDVSYSENGSLLSGTLSVSLGGIHKNTKKFHAVEFSVDFDYSKGGSSLPQDLSKLNSIDEISPLKVETEQKLTKAVLALYDPSIEFDDIKRISEEEILIDEIFRIQDGLKMEYIAKSKEKDLDGLYSELNKIVGSPIASNLKKFMKSIENGDLKESIKDLDHLKKAIHSKKPYFGRSKLQDVYGLITKKSEDFLLSSIVLSNVDMLREQFKNHGSKLDLDVKMIESANSLGDEFGALFEIFIIFLRNLNYDQAKEKFDNLFATSEKNDDLDRLKFVSEVNLALKKAAEETNLSLDEMITLTESILKS